MKNNTNNINGNNTIGYFRSKLERIKSGRVPQQQRMEELLGRMLWAELSAQGMLKGEKIKIEEIENRAGIREKYERWVKESVGILERMGYVKKEGEEYKVEKEAGEGERKEVWKEWGKAREEWDKEDGLRTQAVLAEATMRKLGEIMKGEVPATDIMFPNSSMELVEGIYKRNETSDYFNEVAGEVVRGYIESIKQKGVETGIRIIEIGAGTGGTSEMVLRKLEGYEGEVEEYCYTDLSKAFLMHGEKEYGKGRPYLRYKIFNAGKGVREQGMEIGSYDIVIAANVLHATKNIRETLRNAKALLKKNGIIVLNEISGKTVFTHVTFGLLEGWWLYEDEELRIPGNPGLYPEKWEKVLGEEGFRPVVYPAKKAHDLGQQIIVGGSDGIVRQKKAARAEEKVKTGKELKEAGYKLEGREKGKVGDKTEEELKEKSRMYIKRLVSETLKIPVSKIDSGEALEKYGIDSILVVQLTNSMRKVFENVNSTLFFECQTIDALTEHFLLTQRERLVELAGYREEKGEEAKEERECGEVEVRSRRRERRFLRQGGREEEREGKEIEGEEGIAVIGMSGRYAEAKDVREFWENIKEGKNCIREIPKERWEWERYYDEEKGKEGKMYSKWGGFIEGIDKFDPLFFRISPREAEGMDPQERLFLEEAYGSIEDAGYTPEGMSGKKKVGVFVGVMNGYYATGVSYWSIANRLSYLFNFQGPSMAVDTACSSSITAIHLAAESIRSGLSEIAIAGGVNLIVTAKHYMKLSSMTMLSSGDKCSAFGENGDGFVDGEGVGAIVLKPLRKAEEDGDHIYGVIRGSMLNAGGKTNGYTVPNPAAQGELVREALERAGVNARAVSYIEAHGTGTSLGDPIEIAGLTRAFEKDTQERQYCAIGSVKSNIGHCESAAGIAAVTKVLLQMKHGQLAPSLHAEELNPNIDFEKTPFRVQRKLEEWKRPEVEEGGERKEYPRIAGVSSFGAGGANAHIVIEEYKGTEIKEGIKTSREKPVIIVLSGKDEERLKERAKGLLEAIEREGYGEERLEEMAFTLQTGREGMEERLGFTALTMGEVKEKLSGYLKGEEGITEFFKRKTNENKDTISLFIADEDLLNAVDSWLNKGKYIKILDLWVKGMAFDWQRLYEGRKPQKMSLPTYPFAKERYWKEEYRESEGGTGQSKLHPLLHENESNMMEQRFSTALTGREFYLEDHKVKGKKVLPGVAYLEMARAAVEIAMDIGKEEELEIHLKDVIWARPVVVGEEEVKINIGLYAGEGGGIEYEVYSGEGEEEIVHSQGRAEIAEKKEGKELDIKGMLERKWEREIRPDECYEKFKKMGIEYGAGHKGIEMVYSGKGEALAKLVMPGSVKEGAGEYVLHPAMMDSALQAVIGLKMFNEKEGTQVPFSIDELTIKGGSSGEMWAVLRERESGKEKKVDIDIYDVEGKEKINIRGLMLREMGKESEGVKAAGVEKLTGAITLKPEWEREEKGEGGERKEEERIVVIGGSSEERQEIRERYKKAKEVEIEKGEEIGSIGKKLKGKGEIEHIVWIGKEGAGTKEEERIIEEQEDGVIQVYRIMKAMLELGYGSKEMSWSIITVQTQGVREGEEVKAGYGSIEGLAGSAGKEYPNWKIRNIDIEKGKKWSLEEILRKGGERKGEQEAVREGEWYRKRLVPVRYGKTEGEIYRKGGVYVVIGGAGGIGEAWSEYMVRENEAKIVWIGRREKDEEIERKLEKIGKKGEKPIYIRADAKDKKELEKAYKEIKEKYGKIDGVVNSAIVLKDRSLAKMEEGEFREVLSAKVDVSVRIGQVFRKEALDFILVFSSMQSFEKMAGQSNYAAGCTFEDVYAKQLRKERKLNVKVVNWGYWGSIGIVSKAGYRERMEKAGIGSIEAAEGMEVIEKLLKGPLDQVGYIKTTRPVEMEMIRQDEEIEVCAEDGGVDVTGIGKRITGQEEKYERIKSGRVPQQQRMEELLGRMLWAELSAQGMLKGEKIKIEEIENRAGIRGKYERWVKESVGILERMGYVKKEGEEYKVEKEAGEGERKEVWKEWEKAREEWDKEDGLRTQAVLAEATMRKLGEIMKGEVPATDIMFPNSSMELVEGIYKRNETSDYFNEVAGEVVRGYIESIKQKGVETGIRIIEIGAGTGGTSEMVLRKLEGYEGEVEEYCYTDLSKAFLMHGEKEYGKGRPYLRYKIFNAGKGVREQGMEIGSYDIVIAANVLHATKNIRETLRNAKALLKKNGIIVLNEISGKTVFTHVTFGLLEGWWLYEDEELRIPGNPGLYPEKWEKVLGEEGFRPVVYPAKKAHDLGQQIIVGGSDGIVRQKKAARAEEKVKTGKELKEAGYKLEGREKGKVGDKTEEELKEKSRMYIKRLVSETLKIPVSKIDSGEALEKYGIDSILVVQLTNSMRKVFENVNSTLFFECQTIDALTEHFLLTQRERLVELAGYREEKGEEAKEERESGEVEVRSRRRERRFLRQGGREEEREGKEIEGEEGIAVIGMSGRYAEAKDVREFWENIKEGKNCIREIPKERWEWERYYDEEKGKEGKMYSKWGGFIEGIDKFDPLFFRISPREAEGMDPQERLFLEEAYGSIEDAGYTPEGMSGKKKVGVFVGVMNGYYATGVSYWSIANRLSYLFNFQGPSMAVDTACSSSITAIHLAAESIRSGLSEIAIAGGVNLIVTAKHYMKLSSMTMLSSGDKCSAFGENGDGFVDGEGVGAIVLKPLRKAEEDGDHIYGVIRGSMLNAGGKTNGYTVPNPAAQGELVREALERAGVNARAVSYIEAHGTGTSLGDPIEIAGLTRAFEKDTQERQYCAIGSVKSNIGHCESAAGIAAVTKVLLQMKHGQLAPSLHAEELNPNIDFEKTPFKVQRKLEEWKRPEVEEGGERKEYPRIAGVSSFGAGGANAHIVIEEYKGTEIKEGIKTSREKPVIIVLSGKDEERLKERAKGLLEAIEREGYGEEKLEEMAFTLQTGREGMEERLGFTALTMGEVKEKLSGYLKGEEGTVEIYRGQVKRNKEALTIITADEEMREAIEKWIQRGKYVKLVDLWVKGMTFDWQRLYEGRKPQKMSLPTYPFAKERYWMEESEESRKGKGVVVKSLHPLLQENTSDLTEQRYSTVLTGREFYLEDHKVKGKKVLPGAAYLEMARAAVEKAGRVEREGEQEIKLKNVIWARPVVVGEEEVKVHIGLYAGEDGGIEYEVYSGEGEEEIVHSQGRAEIVEKKEGNELDIKGMLERKWEREIKGEECYAKFKERGMEYGEGHRGLEVVYGGKGEALAKLVMPGSVKEGAGEYVLHPSMMDSALQAVIGLKGEKEGEGALLPFAIEEVEIKGGSGGVMWAVLRERESGKIKKVDIDIYDEEGKERIKVKGLSLRELESEGERAVMMLEPEWKEKEAITGKSGYGEEVVILIEAEGIGKEEMEEGKRSIELKGRKGEGLGERYERYAKRMIEEIKGIMERKPEGRILVQCVTSGGKEKKVLGGLAGILKTAHLENPGITGQMIELEGGEGKEEIKRILKENGESGETGRVRYRKGKREVEVLKEIAGMKEGKSPWKKGGVYLITGGAGGLGRIISEEIGEKGKGSELILTGRRELSKENEKWIEGLREKGAGVEYRRMDVTKKEEAEETMKWIKEKYGKLDVIVHSAGVVKDNFILKKGEEEAGEVLGPKVRGLENLYESSAGLKPERIILFSSIAGVMGNIGQADYSAGNGFMDLYAEYRNEEGGETRVQSINWPLWEEGGMKVDEESKKMMMRQTGMGSLERKKGLKALYDIIGSGKGRAMAAEGDVEKMRERLLTGERKPAAEKVKEERKAESPRDGNKERILEEIRESLIRNVSGILKVKTEDIDVDSELSEYGFDSITFTGFANRLNQEYGLELSPAVFFEHSTLRSISEYLSGEYPGIFNKGRQEKAEEKPVKAESEYREAGKMEGLERNNKRRTRFNRMLAAEENKSEKDKNEPVAIIGISGIFPGAKDVEEFWKNLLEEKDCIGEIPEERWDWKEYYGDPVKERNKTNIKWGGFIDGVYEFDPLFFGISPREAEFMDPQQRLLMTYVWKVIEDAGYSAESLSGTKTGIFVGTGKSDYGELLSQSKVNIEGYSSTGMVPSVGPNRMSYFLNIHGPSEPIETACSSSLVAIHRAINAMEDGSCDTAIVGGINTIITPDGHISFTKAGMLCEDGRCKTFSDKANGYVRGEGAGMLFLKKLKEAERDGDHIYGVIRGTAENHGGRANSLTAPNPKAQAELMVTAYRKAGIDPRTVTYIEAHGTGTPLGDPIEINGLKMAFKELYGPGEEETKAHCGLGTVKSNIGHLELAAGVAGVIKVLLQLKHKTLVKSLHCENLNPYIQIKGSPFYIVQERREWTALKDERGKEIPRRSGVSSFGFGGVNAHIVIEEYKGTEIKEGIKRSREKPVIIVLSGKDEERLKERAKGLLEAIEREGYGDERLEEMAFTLQTGREGMEERLGFTALTMGEVKEKLSGYLKGEEGTVEIYRGQVKRNKEALSVFTLDEDLLKAVDSWLSKGKYAKLLELWVKGMPFDWQRLYEGRKPQKMSLPSYPFAREKYIIKGGSDKSAVKGQVKRVLHPLLQENTSDLTEQRYSTVLTGKEFYLEDHKVKGKKVLPGAAYLEMARAAVEKAGRVEREGEQEIKLKNVIWARPVVVGEEEVKVHIGLYAGEDGGIEYEVYSGEGEEEIVHSQGRAEIVEKKEGKELDIKGMLERKWEREMKGEECYAKFKERGMEYGEGHRGLEVVYGGKGEALAKLVMPGSVKEGAGEYVLHPSMMDSALQAVIGLKGEKEGEGALLPFAIEEVEIKGGSGGVMWAVLRERESGKIKKVDIDIYDEEGKERIKVKGLSLRELESEGERAVMMLEPEWKEKEAITGKSGYGEEVVILIEAEGIGKEEIGEGTRSIELKGRKGEGLGERYERYAKRMIEEIKGIMERKAEGRILVQGLVSGGKEKKVLGGLAGILKTAHLENPGITGQMIELEGGEGKEEIKRILKENGESGETGRVRYRKGKREVEVLKEIAGMKEGESPWKKGGVYLITGGTGGLGRIISEEIGEKGKGSELILTGRRELSKENEKWIEGLREKGAGVEYRRMDVTKREEAEETMKWIKEKYGKLDVIVHSAGVVKDNFILKKGEEEAGEVLGPKVRGLENLYESSAGLKPERIILFSSIAGVMGNIGQADYSAGNGFMDLYAEYRNEEGCETRVQSINWPLWEEGGMKVDEESKKMMMRQTGMSGLERKKGLKALYDIIGSGKGRAMVAEGDVEKMRERLLTGERKPAAEKVKEERKAESPRDGNKERILEEIRESLIRNVSGILKVKTEDIDVDSELWEAHRE